MVAENGNGRRPEKQGKSRAEQGKPPVEYQFKPGQSGNPGGRPKGRTLMAIVREILDAGDQEQKQAVAQMYVGAMLTSSFQHLKEYIEREEGKVPDTMLGKGELVIHVQYEEKPASDTEPNGN